MDEQEQVWSALKNDWELEHSAVCSREEILSQLELRISRLIERQPEQFFQLMYRLDVPENEVSHALNHPDTAIKRVAELVYERQLQKIRSRQQHRPSANPEDDELSW